MRAASAAPRPARTASAFAASRRAPRKPEDRIVHLLLTQPAWWDLLTAEDHDLLHALPSPHADLVGWLERDIVEHGPRPWAAVRTALADDAVVAPALAALRLEDSEDFEAGPAELRLLLDGRMIDTIEARQRELALAAATDPAALDEYRRTQDRVRHLKDRVAAARREASAA